MRSVHVGRKHTHRMPVWMAVRRQFLPPIRTHAFSATIVYTWGCQHHLPASLGSCPTFWMPSFLDLPVFYQAQYTSLLGRHSGFHCSTAVRPASVAQYLADVRRCCGLVIRRLVTLQPINECPFARPGCSEQALARGTMNCGNIGSRLGDTGITPWEFSESSTLPWLSLCPTSDEIPVSEHRSGNSSEGRFVSTMLEPRRNQNPPCTRCTSIGCSSSRWLAEHHRPFSAAQLFQAC